MHKKINEILVLIIIFVPILIVPEIINPNYNILKVLFILEIGIVLLIYLLADNKNIKLDKKDVIILIFLNLILISTCFSSDIKKSIIGEVNRYEGLLMFATYICIYLSSKRYFNNDKEIIKLLNIMFYISMAIGFLGMLQRHIDCEMLYPIFNKGICSTFGNSNFFGSFISIVLPISLSIYILYGNKKSFILALVMFFNMISSGTRSAWVAFCVIGIIGIIYLIKQRNKVFLQRALTILLIFILIFIYLFFGPNSLTKIKMNQLKMDLLKLQDGKFLNQMGSGRVEIWKMTLKLTMVNPIIGCGPDNLKESLIESCYEEVYEFIERTGTIPDKAHNEYLHLAATIGMPGLITYLIFITLILFPKIKLMLKDEKSFIISLTIISYLIQAFFNISTIGVAPIFWFILGICDNENIMKRKSEK